MNLNACTLVARFARPSRNKCLAAVIFYTFDVNGAAIDASVSERLMPQSAIFKAAQSFAPSPHIPICSLRIFCIYDTNSAFRSGPMRAYTLAF